VTCLIPRREFQINLEEPASRFVDARRRWRAARTWFEQITAVYQVLEELRIEAKDTLLVLIKIDSIDQPTKPSTEFLIDTRTRFPLNVSAKTKKRLAPLSEKPSSEGPLSREFPRRGKFGRPPINDGKLLAHLSANG